MTLADSLGVLLRYREALVIGFLVSLVTAAGLMPHAIRKLRGARIVGYDRHKADRPEVAEMGGLVVFLAFNVGVFFVLAFGSGRHFDLDLVILSLVVIAGACIAGILDDLISLRQAFKALISFAFAVPLALFISDYTVAFPGFSLDFGLAYPIFLVPVAVACAANAFNMLEGFNGLGSGLGIVTAVTMIFLALWSGNYLGLFILIPLTGALLAFWLYNAFPAKVFPGDTMTLMVGAALACGAILSKIEFWGGLLLVPHVVEFALKARGRFKVQSFADRVDAAGGLHYEGPVRSLAHLPMKLQPGISEGRLVTVLVTAHAILATAVGASFALVA